ncbi:MAG: metallophosphoesterase family protein [Nanobdellota archaeon]
MKFLAFVDMHEDMEDYEILKRRIEKFDPDFLVCLGDLTFFSHNLNEMLSLLNNLGKKTYMIHGNHEEKKEFGKECEKYKHIKFVHKKMIQEGNTLFIFYGGGGFSQREKDFTSWIKKNRNYIKNEKNIVLCTHAPPSNTIIDKLGDEMHVGVTDYKNFIDNFKPILAISGHIHESYKEQEISNDTLLINPGGDGEIFEL